MVLRDFRALRAQARKAGAKRVAVVMSEDASALAALAAAGDAGLAVAVLIGDECGTRACIDSARAGGLLETATFIPAANAESAAATAVQLARANRVDILLKGKIRTDQLLRAALLKSNGLRTQGLLSDVLLYEDTLSGTRRLAAVTDGGINVAPTGPQLVHIIENAVAVMHRLGIGCPKVALMSATEAVSEALPSTVMARQITESAGRGELSDCEVYGPLALDNALLAGAARAKGISAAVAGHADVLVVPNIEAGNILGKAVKYFGGSTCAHVVMGAKVPILIPSRVETAADKLNSIALGVLMHE